jgi:hypothetical protein
MQDFFSCSAPSSKLDPDYWKTLENKVLLPLNNHFHLVIVTRDGGFEFIMLGKVL